MRFDLKCPSCDAIINEDSVFCPSCGKPIQKQTKFPLAAGIMAIIASCLTLETGNVLLIGAQLEFNINHQIYLHGGLPFIPFPTYFLIVGIIAFVTFAFGLFAGIAAVNRKFVKPTIFGLVLLTTSGVIICVPINSSTSWEIGLPITIFSALSTIFTLKSKSEFH